MADIGQFDSIEPLRLYDTFFLAELVGISAGSIRKVTSGFRTSPLIPRVTRLGPGTVRFSGRDILAWFDDPSGASEQARPQPLALPIANVALAQRRRPGRPTNRERDSELRASGMA